MLDAVIGAAANYNWAQLKPYAISLLRSGFIGEKVLFVHNIPADAKEHLQALGFTLIPCEPNIGVQSFCVSRFAAMSRFLRAEQFRYVVACDTRDLVFQSDPIQWLEANIGQAELVAASECLRYKHEAWGFDNLHQAFGSAAHRALANEVIANAGTIAGRHRAVQALTEGIVKLSVGTSIHNPDQSAYNALLYAARPAYFPVMSEGWTCVAGTTADARRMGEFRAHLLDDEPEIRNGIAYPKGSDIPFAIFHMWDRTAQAKEVYELYNL